jgi:hypothetical protein
MPAREVFLDYCQQVLCQVDWYPEQPVGLRLPTGFKIPHSQRFEFAYEKAQLLKILEADWVRELPTSGSRIQCSAR